MYLYWHRFQPSISPRLFGQCTLNISLPFTVYHLPFPTVVYCINSNLTVHTLLSNKNVTDEYPVNLNCTEGYWLPPNVSVINSNATGKWSPKPEICCQKVECSPLPNITNGHMLSTGNETKDDSMYACNVGYYLTSGHMLNERFFRTQLLEWFRADLSRELHKQANSTNQLIC